MIFTALLVGCAPTTAVVDGKTVPRMDMEFYGQPFAIQVTGAHPKPGSPSGGLRDFGGHVSGNVCGLEVTYDVMHQGDHTHLTGFIDDGAFESTLDVHDEKGISRQIEGQLTGKGGGVHLDIRKNHIYGAVGLRTFELGRQGDKYVGWLKVRQSVTAKATINGAEDLWTLPPAAQAAVLPSLLTCYGDSIEDRLAGTFQVGFGGHQTWEAHHVSAIYHVNTTDVQRQIQNSSSSGNQTLVGPSPR